ncbi:MAG: OmpA family protein [Deltaproteobacteria bacterium]|nr:OmpA family protein [Deltaproteobacteria bacterium]
MDRLLVQAMMWSLASFLVLGTGSQALAQDSIDDLDAEIESGLDDGKKKEKVGQEGETEPAAAVEASSGGLPGEGRLRFYSAAPGGETGLIHVMEAGSGPMFTFRLSMAGGGFSSGTFLKDEDVMASLGVTDYSESQLIGRLGLAFSAWDYVEVFANLRSSSNKNSLSRPSLLQTQGDFEFGAKGFYPVMPYLSVGLNCGVSFYNGIGDVSPAFDSTSVRTALLVSFDARPLHELVPLRVHLNGGMILENTDALEGNRDLTYIEEYALRVDSYHRVFAGIGLDAPIHYSDPVAVQPFIEYTVEIPIGISDEDLAAASMGPDTTLADVIPMRLTPGVRLTYLKYLTLDVAVDIGLGGKKAYIHGVPSTPPYTVWIGLAYAFDPFATAGVPAAADTGRIAGKVLNAADNSPLGGAVVSFSQKDALPSASEFAQGRYRSCELQEGKVAVTASLEGFKPETREIEVREGETAALDFSLEPAPKEPVAPPVTTGQVLGRVLNAADQMPIAHAVISFDETEHAPVASDEMEGKYASCQLPAGTVQMTAHKAGFKPLTQTVEIKVGEKSLQDFALEPEVKLATLSGVVTDEKDKPMVAKVEVFGPQELVVSSAADTGAFASQLPIGQYRVKVSADGYLAKGREFELKENATVMAEFKLTPKPKKVIVVLAKDAKKIQVKKKIHFASGKAKLRADAYQILDGVIDVLVNHPEITRVRIEGHTDSMGSAKFNEELSQKRAEAVMNYLLEQGIPSGKLEAKGFGEARPIAPNSTSRGREQNRRVEFMLVD